MGFSMTGNWNPSDCDLTCPGDPTQLCGGFKTFGLYVLFDARNGYKIFYYLESSTIK